MKRLKIFIACILALFLLTEQFAVLSFNTMYAQAINHQIKPLKMTNEELRDSFYRQLSEENQEDISVTDAVYAGQETTPPEPTGEPGLKMPEEKKMVRSGKYPDLIVNRIEWTPMDPKAGDPVQFDITLKNKGSKSLPIGQEIGLFFKLGDDIYQWNVQVGKEVKSGDTIEVKAGAIYEGSIWEAKAGNHEITVFVDAEDKIEEENEGNNKVIDRIKVEEAPVALQIKEVEGKAQLEWSSAKAGDTYTIKKGTSIQSLSEAATGTNSTSYRDNDIQANTTYYYQVTYQDANGMPTAVSNIVVWGQKLKTPRVYSKVDDGQVRVSWEKVKGGETFTVYKKGQEKGQYQVVASGIQDNRYIDTDVSEGNTYYYAVKAYGKNNSQSDLSEGEKVKVGKEKAKKFKPDGDDDGDGLTNEEEILNGLKMDKKDSDGDGVDDYTKVQMKKEKSQQEAAKKTKKVKKKFGTKDGKVSIDVEGWNDLETAPLKAEKKEDPFYQYVPGLIGEAVDLTAGEAEIEKADITMSYAGLDLKGTKEEDLVIYWVDEVNGKLVAIENITVDKKNKTVTGTTPHFSTYILGSSDAVKNLKSLDIVFLVDNSKSMVEMDPVETHTENGVSVPHTSRSDFMQKFANHLTDINTDKQEAEKVRMGIMGFSGCTKLWQGLTGDQVQLNAKIQGLVDDIQQSNTQKMTTSNIAHALWVAKNQFEYYNADQPQDAGKRRKVMVLLTDGNDTYGGIYQGLARIIANCNNTWGTTEEKIYNHITLHTVGVGQRHQESPEDKVQNSNGLVEIASGSNGSYNAINSMKNMTVAEKQMEVKEAFEKVIKSIYFEGITAPPGLLIEIENEIVSRMTFSEMYKGLAYEEARRLYGKMGANMLTGNYVTQGVDIAVASEGMGLSFSRTYNSDAGHEKTDLGYGWRSNYDSKIESMAHSAKVTTKYTGLNLRTDTNTDAWVITTIAKGAEVEYLLNGDGTPITETDIVDNPNDPHDPYTWYLVKTSDGQIGWCAGEGGGLTYNYLTPIEDASIKVTYPSGTAITFDKNTEGGYTAPIGVYDQLEKNGTQYILRTKDQTQWVYEAPEGGGKILEIKDPYGNCLAMEYEVDSENNQRLHYVKEKLSDGSYGRALTFAYNQNGLLESVSNPRGWKAEYFYDNKGNLTTVRDLEEKETTYTYYHGTKVLYEGANQASQQYCNRLESITDANQHRVVKNDYDPYGRLVRQYDAENNVRYQIYKDIFYKEDGTKLEKSDAELATYYIDEDGYESKVEFSLSQMKPIEEWDAEQIANGDEIPSTEHQYYIFTGEAEDNWMEEYENWYPVPVEVADSQIEEFNGLVSQNRKHKEVITDKLGYSTGYWYDEMGNLCQIIDHKNGTITRMEYNDCHKVIKKTVMDEHAVSKERATLYEYDGPNKNVLTSVKQVTGTNPDNYIIHEQVGYEYYAIGNNVGGENCVAKIHGLVKKIQTQKRGYDANDQLGLQVVNVKEYEYGDEWNNKTKESVKVWEKGASVEKLVTTWKYDDLGRVEEVSDGKANVAYEGDGSVQAYDQKYTYDRMNRVVEKWDASGNVVKTGYDHVGNKAWVTDQRGKTTRYDYTRKNEAKKIVDPSGNTTLYYYDGRGNIVRETDARGYSTYYDYEYDGRLERKEGPTGLVTTYDYKRVKNARGKYDYVETVTDPTSLQTITRTDFRNPQAAVSITDLSNWQVQSFAGEPTNPQWNYTVLNDNLTVTQTIEAKPSIYVSNFDIEYGKIEANFSTSDADDDFMGFVFGYQDPQHFYLFDWKKTQETYQNNITAKAGMSVKKINSSTAITQEDLWSTQGSTQGDEKKIDTLYHNDIPYSSNVGYRLVLEYQAGYYVITIMQGATVLNVISIEDDTYLSGKFGFYTSSQANVQFTNLKKTSYDSKQVTVTQKKNDQELLISKSKYYVDGTVDTIEDATGKVTKHLYDATGRQTAVIGGYTEGYGRSWDGILQGPVGGDGSRIGNIEVRTEWDTCYAKAWENGVELPEYSVYDVETTKSPSGEEYKRYYNGIGQLVMEMDQEENRKWYTYDIAGNLASSTDFKGNKITNEYDCMNRLRKVVYPNSDPDPEKTTYQVFEYDAAGNVAMEQDRRGVKTEYSYNDTGRLEKKTVKDVLMNVVSGMLMDVTVEEYEYDAVGHIITKKDACGYPTQYTYTPQGLLETEEDAMGYVKYYVYDEVGNVKYESSKRPFFEFGVSYYRNISLSDGSSRVVLADEYIYDGFHRLIEIEDRKGQKVKENIYHDSNGRLEQEVFGNGGVKTYGYDDLGRVQTETYSGDESIETLAVTYAYTLDQNIWKKQNGTDETIEYTYTSRGQVETETTTKDLGDGTTEAVTVSRSYDANGNLEQEGIVGEVPVVYSYDSMNRLDTESKTVLTPGGLTETVYTTKYHYDNQDNVLYTENILSRINTGDGSTIYSRAYKSNENEYDELGRVVKITDPLENEIEKLRYHPNGAQSMSIDAFGNQTQFIYDYNNRLRQTIDTNGYIESREYNRDGEVTAITDKNGKRTSYNYDENNQLRKISLPSGEIVEYTYDAAGNLKTQKNGKGYVTTYEYNVQDLLKKVIYPDDTPGTFADNPYEAYTYYGDGSVETYTDRKGSTTTYTYGIHGVKEHKVLLGDQEQTTGYTYDNRGNTLTVSTQYKKGQNTVYGNTITRTYDHLDRVKTKTVDGVTSTYTYDLVQGLHAGLFEDGQGSIALAFRDEEHPNVPLYKAEKTSDDKGNVTTKVYDKAGRLAYVIDGNGMDTSAYAVKYEYRINGARQKTTYAAGTSEEYVYYNNGLLHQIIGKKADGTVVNATLYQYDNVGNVTVKGDLVNGTNKVVYYKYDDLNRLVKVTEPSIERTTTYQYDGAGNRAKEEVRQPKQGNPDITEIATRTYSYTPTNELEEVVETKDEVRFVSDIISYTGQINGWGSIEKDKSNGQWEIGDGQTLTISGIKYDKGIGCHAYSEIHVDLNGQYQAFKSDVGVDDEVGSYGEVQFYLEDGSSNVLAYSPVMRGSDSEPYTMEADIQGKQELKLKVYHLSDAYCDHADWADVRVVLNSTQKTYSYTYDANGNQTQVAENGVSQTTNEYDLLNQLVKTTAGTTVVENEYNGEGLRIAKTVDGSTTKYAYEYSKVVLELDGNNNQTGRNIYGFNLTTRTITDGQGVDTTFNYMYNGHGDVVALVDPAGTVHATYYYDAFGNILEKTGTAESPYTYAGYQWDDETGLYYLNARMYDPTIARFLQEDTHRGHPGDALSLNLYTYCANNPLIYWDYSGHCYQCGAVSYINYSPSECPLQRNRETYYRDEGTGKIDLAKARANSDTATFAKIATKKYEEEEDLANYLKEKEIEKVLYSAYKGQWEDIQASDDKEYIIKREKLEDIVIEPVIDGINYNLPYNWKLMQQMSHHIEEAMARGDEKKAAYYQGNFDNFFNQYMHYYNAAMERGFTISNDRIVEDSGYYKYLVNTYNNRDGIFMQTIAPLCGSYDDQASGRVAFAMFTKLGFSNIARNKFNGSMPKDGFEVKISRSNETFYRTMSKEDYATFSKTGKIPATKETFISPTKSFSEGYQGVTVEFKVKAGTLNQLEQIGVRDMSNLTKNTYGNLATVQKGWTQNNAFFKGEGTQINIGLGKGTALDTFNNNIVGHTVLGSR